MENKSEALLWYKWLYWSKGISGREFRGELMRDINDITCINAAINEKNLREAQLRKLLSKVGVR